MLSKCPNPTTQINDSCDTTIVFPRVCLHFVAKAEPSGTLTLTVKHYENTSY